MKSSEAQILPIVSACAIALLILTGLSPTVSWSAEPTLEDGPRRLLKDINEETVKSIGCKSDSECGAGERCRSTVRFSNTLSYTQCVMELASGLEERDCLDSKTPGFCFLVLHGPINANQPAALSRFLKRVSKVNLQGVTIELDTAGGDIEAAMELGRQLRSVQAKAYVMKGATCASACVLILAGATNRFVVGSVIIHRPYRASAVDQGYSVAQASFSERSRLIRDYLSEMNVPVELYDAMLEIPPESGRLLSEDELSRYGLNRMDPVAAEEFAARDAKRRGFSMSEYYSRKARVESCHESLSNYDARNSSYSYCESLWVSQK